MKPFHARPKRNLLRSGIAAANHSFSSSKALVPAAVLAGLLAGSPQVLAEGLVLEEITVTAQKREASLQDTPVSVQALNSLALQQLGVESFEDYALLMPSLSYSSAGPGTSQLYMRGAADGGDGNASGSHPSVAVYLDEQPVTAIGRNLDIHVYDIERVEALAGPQSTLFGASAQSGTLRIITNKPQMDSFEAGFDVGMSTIKGGDNSHIGEGFINQPLGDNAAIRLVAWNKKDGGYIDNIAGSRTSALDYADYAGSQIEEDNSRFVAEDFNELENKGFRAAVKVNINEQWSGTLSYLQQNQDTKGVWFHDQENPNGEIGDLEVQRFGPDDSEDKFKQYGLTIEGDLGFASLVYAGSFMNRDVNENVDYSDYSESNNTWISYYSCDYSSYNAPSTSPCTSNSIFYNSDNSYKRDTHEIRLQSQSDGKLQYVAGYYYEDSSHDYRQEWVQPGMAKGADYEVFGQADLWYLTDQKRTDQQQAFFGEISYDLTDTLTATLGGRYFENEGTLKGVSGYGTTNAKLIYAEANIDSKVTDSGSIFKANVNYSFGDNNMVYLTWSEGYRPGGINRASNTIIPATYDSDFLTNFEFGWKTQWLDNRLRWNGALYHMTWEDMQLTKYDSSYGIPLGVTVNVSEAVIDGIETDLTFVISEGWTISTGVAYNIGETAEDLVVGNNFAPKGTALPSVPELKFNINSRYNFTVADMPAYGQLVYAYVGESYDDIFNYTTTDQTTDRRDTQADYDNLNLSVGIDSEKWGLDLFINNLTDERAEITRGAQGGSSWDSTITANRPRTMGVKYRLRF